MKKVLITVCGAVGLLSACNSGGGSGNAKTNYPSTPTNLVGVNDSYKCLPSGDSISSSKNGLKIAYGDNCEVASANNTIKPSLESMAIAISNSAGNAYCTGTPLSYDATTGIGYVLTAAHCVVGDVYKPANTQITSKNIKTFSHNYMNDLNYVNQTLNAADGSGTTGKITAVYVPEQYCENPEIRLNKKNRYVCSNLPQQNGDIALLQVQFTKPVNYSNAVKLANNSFNMPSPSYIMALGYGITNKDKDNTDLYYITYENFATNSYWGDGGLSTIMNGYSVDNSFYSIICSGDSGGGDFYWDGNSWQLVGVHSYGVYECGQPGSQYYDAEDVSADVRPFNSKLTSLMSSQFGVGCDLSLAAKNKFVCADK